MRRPGSWPTSPTAAWHGCGAMPERGMGLIRRAVSRLEADPVLAASSERQLDLASAWCDTGRPDRAWPCSNRAVELARSEGAVGRLPDALAWAAWLDGEGGRWATGAGARQPGTRPGAGDRADLPGLLRAGHYRGRRGCPGTRRGLPAGMPARQSSSAVNLACGSCSSWPGAARPCSTSAAAGLRRRSPATTECAGWRRSGESLTRTTQAFPT